MASASNPFADFAFVPSAGAATAASTSGTRASSATPSTTSVSTDPSSTAGPTAARKLNRVTVVAARGKATAAAGGGGRLEAAAAAAASSLSGLTTHADFVAALEAVTDDPLALEPGAGENIVVFRGSPTAKLMVIGEAPGATEDELKKPFVGRAGQLLDQILQSVQFDVTRDVYVSNVVRRRPPGNRNPLAGEIAFFLPWLLKEIELVDPHVILLAGSFPMKALLEDEKRGITKVRGQWFEKQIGGRQRLCMPIFHPSYLLRNQSRAVGGPKWLTWQDIQDVRKHYQIMAGDSNGGP